MCYRLHHRAEEAACSLLAEPLATRFPPPVEPLFSSLINDALTRDWRWRPTMPAKPAPGSPPRPCRDPPAVRARQDAVPEGSLPHRGTRLPPGRPNRSARSPSRPAGSPRRPGGPPYRRVRIAEQTSRSRDRIPRSRDPRPLARNPKKSGVSFHVEGSRPPGNRSLSVPPRMPTPIDRPEPFPVPGDAAPIWFPHFNRSCPVKGLRRTGD